MLCTAGGWWGIADAVVQVSNCTPTVWVTRFHISGG